LDGNRVSIGRIVECGLLFMLMTRVYLTLER
jgi:hypothetical protein